MDWVGELRSGNKLAIARLLTQVENDTPQGRAALDEIFPHTGRAHLVGVTGAPGVGKSSLVTQIAWACRHPQDGKPPRTVAIIAVDPTSPFSGGAILGDRVRMRDLSGDPGVFIRSMATRGALGGIARTTVELVQVLDTAGYEMILVETVGAGQSEVEVASLTQTTIVVEAPGLGDDIQAIKAGILEIGDILVINKADLPGSDAAERALRAMLELRGGISPGDELHHGFLTELDTLENTPERDTHWNVPVLRCIATNREGTAELLRVIDEHYEYLKRSGELRRREWARITLAFERLIQQTLVERWRKQISANQVENVMRQLYRRKLSPYQALANAHYGTDTNW